MALNYFGLCMIYLFFLEIMGDILEELAFLFNDDTGVKVADEEV